MQHGAMWHGCSTTHVGPVNDRSSLSKVLSKVDFPTFGRPTIAT